MRYIAASGIDSFSLAQIANGKTEIGHRHCAGGHVCGREGVYGGERERVSGTSRRSLNRIYSVYIIQQLLLVALKSRRKIARCRAQLERQRTS